MAAKVCVFDVNETLISFDSLDEWFSEIFGSSLFRQLWFKTTLSTAWSLAAIGKYEEFKSILESTLESLAEENGIEMSAARKAEFKERMKALKVHADVASGLQILKDAGYRIAALTNSSEKTAVEHLKNAGVSDLFERCFSTDSVKVYKPAASPYEYAAHELQVKIEDMWLVAAHAWDTTGAKEAGAKAALVKRKGHGLNKLYAQPNVSGKDLPEVAQAIVEYDQSFTKRISSAAKAQLHHS